MKKIIPLVVIMVLVVGTAWGKNYEITKKADEYTLKIEIDKNPPVVGKNNMTLTVQDPSGKNITDAQIRIEYGMAPMPGMPASNFKAQAALQGDRYGTVFEPTMAGPWNLSIKITRAAKTSTAKLTLDVK